MIRVFILAFLLLSFLTSPSFALDEDTYVRLTAETVIAAHNFKGDVAGMNQWLSQTQEQNAVFMSGEWQSYEQNIVSDSANKGRIYNRILEVVRSKGYKARISNLSGGYTNIEIE